jgi:hypothetical protein
MEKIRFAGMSHDLPARRSIRLPGYDYSGPGACFITMCTQNREPLFGKIAGGKTHLTIRPRLIPWKRHGPSAARSRRPSLAF